MIQPTSDRIVVKVRSAEEKVTESGLVIPKTVTEKDKPQLGEVKAVGPGRTEAGVQIPVAFSVGDTVLFSKFSGIDIEVDDEKVLILLERDVLATVANK